MDKVDQAELDRQLLEQVIPKAEAACDRMNVKYVVKERDDDDFPVGKVDAVWTDKGE